MGRGRAFEYTLVALFVLVLVGVFGHYVLNTHRQLAGAKLTTAYHAMQTSMILANTRCLVEPALRCAGNAVSSVVLFREGLRIRMQNGYPAASQDGIVEAAGLDAGVYEVHYTPQGLSLHIAEQPSNTGCRVRYILPSASVREATLRLDIHGC